MSVPEMITKAGWPCEVKACNRKTTPHNSILCDVCFQVWKMTSDLSMDDFIKERDELDEE